MELLKAREEDIKRKLHAENVWRGMEPKAEVNMWLTNVRKINSSIASMQEKIIEDKRWLPNYMCRFKLGKFINKKIKEVDRLLGQSIFPDALLVDVMPQRGKILPTTSSAQRSLEAIWKYLNDGHTGIIGVFPLDKGSPDMSLHLDKWSTKEEINVLDFNKAFCELWHSSTNIICVSIGDLSLSLWDMHIIGGIPVHETFFDEVVPSAKELSQTDQQGKPFLPKTCAYLFSAFYRLSNGASKEVSIHDWVNFWFKGPERYTEPPPRGPKHHAKPKLNHIPNGYIDVSFLP
ncbi:hypothetical protein BC332_24197 [Capsicum chinense]|nr:hypothetical protein BC332_24197 [Capsicum chinense]